MRCVGSVVLGDSLSVRLLDFDDEGRKGHVAGDKHLMRDSRGHVGDVAGTKLHALPSLDGGAANLTRTNDVSADDSSADNERGATIENNEQVGELLVQLGDAIAAADREHGSVLRIPLEGL